MRVFNMSGGILDYLPQSNNKVKPVIRIVRASTGYHLYRLINAKDFLGPASDWRLRYWTLDINYIFDIIY